MICSSLYLDQQAMKASPVDSNLGHSGPRRRARGPRLDGGGGWVKEDVEKEVLCALTRGPIVFAGYPQKKFMGGEESAYRLRTRARLWECFAMVATAYHRTDRGSNLHDERTKYA